MFQWYKAAEVCYAFLEDLVPGHAPEDEMQHCRWFSRGWTLQELIAPRVVKFFSKSWELKGTKADYAGLIAQFTNIHEGALLGSRELSSFCIAQKMAWAASRRTKRLEDTAYCLLGIFDVNMPLIYGEGEKAFRRLQEEIVRRDNDLTILAWRGMQDSHETFIGCFAPSPAHFAGRHDFFPLTLRFAEFSTTNKGLFLSTKVFLQLAEIQYAGESPQTIYWMPLGHGSSVEGGIYLRKLAPRFYCRLAENNIQRLKPPYNTQSVSNIHIVIESRATKSDVFAAYRRWTLRVRPSENLTVTSALPTAYWDHTDNLFLSEDHSPGIDPLALLLKVKVLVETEYVQVTLLCHKRMDHLGLDLGILEDGGPFRQSHLIYASRYQESGVPWDIIGYDKADKWPLRNKITAKIAKKRFRLAFDVQWEEVASLWGNIRNHRLVVSVTRLKY